MSRIIIFPYKMASRSSKALADELEAVRVYPDKRYRPRQTDLVINWGNSIIPDWWGKLVEAGARVLNYPVNVRNASNKLEALRILQDRGVQVPDFTSHSFIAHDSYRNGFYARTVLDGHCGRGIRYCPRNIRLQDIPNAPLYVKAIRTKAEYRVHVFNGEVISYAKKRRYDDDPIQNEQQDLVRSHANGWIFCRDHLRRLDRIEDMAIEAVNALRLDFGGVDIIRDVDNVCYVLEVNTACGMEGQTLEAYREAIANFNN